MVAWPCDQRKEIGQASVGACHERRPLKSASPHRHRPGVGTYAHARGVPPGRRLLGPRLDPGATPLTFSRTAGVAHDHKYRDVGLVPTLQDGNCRVAYSTAYTTPERGELAPIIAVFWSTGVPPPWKGTAERPPDSTDEDTNPPTLSYDACEHPARSAGIGGALIGPRTAEPDL